MDGLWEVRGGHVDTWTVCGRCTVDTWTEVTGGACPSSCSGSTNAVSASSRERTADAWVE